ncbi:uncharacterized protein LOC132551058 [Ylistrum balloti]|uniref:uncharacterized protein LOC132551058 n=1 Tax=Ylistrum balloti TaxID=509963 RepID=UPI002905CB81|nr:uncharacterized protein LOC132551058 [Ylistrum balloti]
MNGNYNAIEDDMAELFVEQAISQVSLNELQNVEECSRPVSIHDICANTDVSRPTEPENMGRRHQVLDSEGEDEDDEEEVLVYSTQIDLSEQTHRSTMAVIQEEDVLTSVDIDRRVSLPLLGASGTENSKRITLSKAASHSGVGSTNSMQKFIQMFSWKRRTKSDTSNPGNLPELQEEGTKPDQEGNRSERRGLFGNRKQQNRNRQRKRQEVAPNVHLTSGETPPAMTPKVFQTFFHNAVEGRKDIPANTDDDDTIDFSSYIL